MTALTGPDLVEGIELTDIPVGGGIVGHAYGAQVLLARPDGAEVFAVGATCTHAGAPLVDGLVADGVVRCPWHHACFDVRTGEAIATPALDPLPCWRTERRGSRVVVAERLVRERRRAPARAPSSVVIIGGGAAGTAAAEMLRREGYGGRVTIVCADRHAPVDRPNLSKDYLAGSAPEQQVWLRSERFYVEHEIELLLRTRAIGIDPASRRIDLSDGTTRTYGALLLATGADPAKLEAVPGADLPHVRTLRSLTDCRQIIERVAGRKGLRAVIIGASFIGLEVAAGLRARGVEVDVVAPELLPLERILGRELGELVRALHEERGVRFHLSHVVSRIDAESVLLDDGRRLACDLVVVGAGVRPAVALAKQAGLSVNDGVLVDAYLETSTPGIFAAGDIARWQDHRTGESHRVEHWAVAARQGQAAARNILGRREPFAAVPFFWSQHYELAISYVGHGVGWQRVDVLGSLADRSCVAVFRRGGLVVAMATIGRDRVSLEAERLLERNDQAGLEALIARQA